MHDKGLATLGAVAGFAGLSAAAACCVLPLALASVGIAAGGLASLGPLHAPLSTIALLAVAGGWFFYLKRRRACVVGDDCAPPSRSTFVLLIFASGFVLLSAIWPFIEAPLMRIVE